jgi:beta-galactosidase
VNGKNLGRKKMPHDGHLEWTAVYKPGKVKAVGYRGGKKICEETVYTAGAPAALQVEANRPVILADGRDLSVVNLSVQDVRGHFVPTACVPVTVTVDGPARILGAGNGDPAFRERERPEDPEARSFTIETFNGLAQVLIQSVGEPGDIHLLFTTESCTYLATISAVRP